MSYKPDERFVLVDRETVGMEPPKQPRWYWRGLAKVFRPKLGTWLWSKAHGVATRIKTVDNGAEPEGMTFQIEVGETEHEDS